ncbi:MAG TPA: nucleotide-binding protein [Polyangiaceae bacterium]
MRVFIASSSEQIAVARRVRDALQSAELTATVWDEGTFDFSEAYIESLEDELECSDFAVVVLTADDRATVRKNEVVLPRDNVIFELGLFIGRLGRKRCFFLIDGASETEVASDLSGVNPVKYYDAALAGGGRRTLEEQLGKVRTRMLAESVRYKPPRDVREAQDALWRFACTIAGPWWERMRAGEDDKSAISYVRVTVDPVTNDPCLYGYAYDQAGEFLAEWHTVVTGATLKPPATIYYRWEGEHEEEHAQIYGGGGQIVFDDESLTSASGYYYDTNFANITAGAHTRVKHFGFYRCDPADELVMKKPQSSEAKKLAAERAAALEGR